MSPSLAAAFGTHDIWDTKAALSKTAPMEKSTISKLSYPLLHQAIDQDGEPNNNIAYQQLSDSVYTHYSPHCILHTAGGTKPLELEHFR